MFVSLTRSPYRSGLHSQHGVTLIEVIIVIIIIGILTAIAAPNVTASLERQRNKQAVDTVVSAFREARTESQLRRQDVVVESANSVLRLLVEEGKGDTKKTLTLREFSFNQNASITTKTPKVVFKSNKTVTPYSSSSNATNNSVSASTFEYTIFCNKDNKQGSKVVVDNHGNVKIDNGASQC